MDPKERINELSEILKQANYQYYVLDDPQMPDFEYDRLLRELEELEAIHPEWIQPDSPTQRVGGEAVSQFEKVTHPVPLMSLQDVFSLEELNDFLGKILASFPGISFSVEPKIDGRPGRNPGRWTGGGGCHRKPENHPLHPHGSGKCPCPPHRPG